MSRGRRRAGVQINQTSRAIKLIRWGRHLVRDGAGTAAIEFAFVAPVLFALLIGTAKFGLTLHDYVTLTNGVDSGARLFAISRGGTSPYTNALAQLRAAAPDLSTSTTTVTMLVNNTACSTDSACTSALTNAQGLPATVSATYPCDLLIYGINFFPSCTLSSSTTEYVQ
jgi:Flp pilus assembly protein TadG